MAVRTMSDHVWFGLIQDKEKCRLFPFKSSLILKDKNVVRRNMSLYCIPKLMFQKKYTPLIVTIIIGTVVLLDVINAFSLSIPTRTTISPFYKDSSTRHLLVGKKFNHGCPGAMATNLNKKEYLLNPYSFISSIILQATASSDDETTQQQQQIGFPNNIYNTVVSTNFSSSSIYLTNIIKPPSLKHGLSKFHLSIMSRTVDRQRFVTGQYPILVSVIKNPTRKWLNLGRSKLRKDGTAAAETEILVNGTTPDRSLASIDRFQWIDDDERIALRNIYEMVSVELLAEIHLERPGYLQILKADGAGSTSEVYHRSKQLAGTSNNGGKQNQQLSKTIQSNFHYFNRWKLSSSILNDIDDIQQIYCDRLWVTGFSLASRQGILMSIDSDTCRMNSINQRSAESMLWPNEVQEVPNNLVDNIISPTLSSNNYSQHHHHATVNKMKSTFISSKNLKRDALLVCDGFLVPTKDRGGLYIVNNPGNPVSEWTVRLTDEKDRWFYHRAVWIDLTGDGRQSLLSARCKVSTVLGRRRSGDGVVTSGIRKYGQLVWLECPKPSCYDPKTGTPLENDGTIFDALSTRHLPWKTRILATGPDVMFSVADLDTEDDTIEVLSSNFFQKKVTLHSIKKGPIPKVTFSRVIDEQCGQAFGSILADLDRGPQANNEYRDEHNLDRKVIDSGSTVKTLKEGDYFSHLLVTSHECSLKTETMSTIGMEKIETTNPVESKRELAKTRGTLIDSSSEGGSLFSYRVPKGKGAWMTEKWIRSTIASGFKVNGQLNNMINPGAPGFVYTFYSRKGYDSKRPMIAIAGDCAESAYVYRPANENIKSLDNEPCTDYKLLIEIECGATVGSIGIGYDDFSSMDQEFGYAKLYIPCYEKNKVLVFGLGNGDDDALEF